MTAAHSDHPAYDDRRILDAAFPRRVRFACGPWAAPIDPRPRIVMALYRAQYLFAFIGEWAFSALVRGLQPRPLGEHAAALARGRTAEPG